jgi:hypothetical protein
MMASAGIFPKMRAPRFLMIIALVVFFLIQCNYAFLQHSPPWTKTTNQIRRADSLYIRPTENNMTTSEWAAATETAKTSSTLGGQNHKQVTGTDDNVHHILQPDLRIPNPQEASSSSRQTTTTTKEAEQRRAIEGVTGIMNLYNSSSSSSSNGDNGISNHIVCKALEGLLQRIYRDRRTATDPSSEILLEQLESLIWRCHYLQIVPTHTSLDNLWRLQQGHCDDHLHHQTNNSSKHIERSVRLLTYWSNWSSQEGSSNTIPEPPPFEYIQTIFAFCRHTNVTMSCTMWDMYEQELATTRTRNREEVLPPPRDFLAMVLHILEYSPTTTPWKIQRQYRVLQDLHRLYQSTNQSDYAPRRSELESCLRVASQQGAASEATWLVRTLSLLCDDKDEDDDGMKSKNTTNNNNTTKMSRSFDYTKAWFLSLCKSQERGAPFYSERLLQEAAKAKYKSSFDTTICMSQLQLQLHHREYYNMALCMWADTRTAGAGMRAQALFERMVTAFRESGDETIRPDEESVHHVVAAYLHEDEQVTLQQLTDANRFLQHAIPNLLAISTNNTNSAAKRGLITFDELFEAFSKYHSRNTITIL